MCVLDLCAVLTMLFAYFRDEVRDVGERVGSYMNKKHFLHATQLLVTSLNRLGTDLKMVEALKEVNSDLHSRKEVSFILRKITSGLPKFVCLFRQNTYLRNKKHTLTCQGGDWLL